MIRNYQRIVALVLVSGIATGAVACSHNAPPAAQPSPQATAVPGGGGRAAGPGAPGGRPRRPPNYVLQDSIRRATVAEVLKSVAGRENEPAGRVFKNVKLLRNVPVREFLKTMDETYGRGLGYTCTNCHVEKDFAADTKKGKTIARQMQVMTNAINSQHLSRIKELDDDYEKASCVSCHKSTEKVHNTMTQPTNAPG